ncbi:(deoxy)nucleoside triphosphate pyrophosphohydrolase [Listeria weihenstephanensis]|uniref:8-oxo-dGTP diphosphatase n=1 Tax=Listeria weihenstephanensis TaxID=1006155 RepID=A0A841Z7J3_9LIST|nr:(deoxy)nucleoside triphosphate pyrophosphohydrolase [Listeria weihenstephanensis]MBC1502021.1 (deoxy)nucleoside triphosphate pyrophosphohydrolase [Listeria weihenstephanensis]
MKKDIHVVGAVIIQNDKILCAQRAENTSLALQWEFPGGKIEKDETPQNALIREIKEEMGCEVAIGEQLEHTVHEYDFGIVHLTTFLCHLIHGEPQLLEHHAIKWLKPSELNSLSWAPADIPAVHKLQKLSFSQK